jgi:16S rRNA (uracil1498-N3)-methyltransferase
MLPADAERHLRKVLRRADGATVSYTDGDGTLGVGVYVDGRLNRGEETVATHPSPEIVVAVAPPRSIDRTRFLIEKAAELGVDEVRWLETRHGEGRPPRHAKAHAWAVGALEQSRGAWLTAVSGPDDQISPAALVGGGAPGHGAVLFAHPGAGPLRDTLAQLGSVPRVVIAVGPEGGFARDELPADATLVGLGEGVLRVETAAIAAVAAIRLA